MLEKWKIKAKDVFAEISVPVAGPEQSITGFVPAQTPEIPVTVDPATQTASVAPEPAPPSEPAGLTPAADCETQTTPPAGLYKKGSIPVRLADAMIDAGRARYLAAKRELRNKREGIEENPRNE